MIVGLGFEGMISMRPYEEKLIQAGHQGLVLKRQDIYGSGPPVDELSLEAQKIVRKYCTESVVDFGAGCGALAKYLSDKVRYLGIESNPSAVEMAHGKGRNVVLGDVTKTEFEDESFQVCTMLEVLEHIDDYEQVILEARRVCKECLVITVPNIGVLPAMSEYQVVPWHLLEATHFNFFTPASLEKVLLRFFPSVRVWQINEWFKPGFYMNIAAVASKAQ